MNAVRRSDRRRSETRNPTAILIVASIVGLLAIGYIVFAVRSVDGAPGVDYGNLYAELPEVGGLRQHNEIRIAGVRVGQITEVETDNGNARARLQLDPGTGGLPADTRVEIRGKGLLGTRYLELVPGRSSRMLDDGATIHAGRRSITNGVPEVLDAFNEETRGGLGSMLDGIGDGLLGQGQRLNKTIARLPALTTRLNRITRSTLARGPAARKFVPSLASATGAFDAAREDIAAGFGAAADGLEPFASERDPTQATLIEAAPTLASMRAGFGRGRVLLASVRSLAQALDRTLPGAPAAFRSTTRLLRESPRALRRGASLLTAARRSVPAVLRVTDSLSPNLVPLRRLFSDLDPIVARLGRHGCDVETFAANWRSLLGFGTGPSSRTVDGHDVGNFNSLRLSVLAGTGSTAGLLPSSSDFIRDRDVYPAPCTYPPQVYSPTGLDVERERSAR